MTITSEKSGTSIKIYINNILHLFIADRITSLTSWNMENSLWIVELTTKNNRIKLEYDSPSKWEQILNELDKLVNHG